MRKKKWVSCHVILKKFPLTNMFLETIIKKNGLLMNFFYYDRIINNLINYFLIFFINYKYFIIFHFLNYNKLNYLFCINNRNFKKENLNNDNFLTKYKLI